MSTAKSGLSSHPPGLKAARAATDIRAAMTTIRTTCPRCGEVDMGPEAILLSLERGGSEGFYRFVCPECFRRVEKRADRKIVALLVSAGVDVAEPPSARQTELDLADAVADSMLRHPAGGGEESPPPFTMDDVIQFHFLLQDDAYIRRFLEGI
jgi:predicted RNA-binding Zn-ribbon protein involved in translation (DUF1610 family)